MQARLPTVAGALRDERKALELQLSAAHEKAPKAVVDGAELAQARKVAAQAAAERDAHARQARDLQAALDVEREKERGLQAHAKTEKRAASHSQRERQQLVASCAELRAEKKEALAALALSQEKAKSLRSDLDRAQGFSYKGTESMRRADPSLTAAAAAAAAQSVHVQSAADGAARGARAAQLVALRRATHTTAMAQALGRWTAALLALRLYPAEAEARRLRGCERDAASLTKQCAAASRSLREERAAHQQVVARLKAERRSAAAARQDKETSARQLQQRSDETAAARAREEAALAAVAPLRS